jgi:hypothetical protein
MAQIIDGVSTHRQRPALNRWPGTGYRFPAKEGPNVRRGRDRIVAETALGLLV